MVNTPIARRGRPAEIILLLLFCLFALTVRANAAAADEITLEDLARRALAQHDLHRLGRYTLDSRRAPDTWQHDFSAMLLDPGNEFLAAGDPRAASLAYRVGLFFYADDRHLGKALAALDTNWTRCA